MKQVFPIIPAGAPAAGTLALMGVLLIALLALFAYTAYASRHVRFELSEDGLSIRGDLYGRFISRQDLVPEQAKAIDLTSEKPYALSWRTNGVGLPGYKAGWFKLKNGEKALAFVTDARRIVYIPTRLGYSVLLSVERPAEFVRALQLR